jgi:hypothetical protein
MEPLEFLWQLWWNSMVGSDLLQAPAAAIERRRAKAAQKNHR